MFLKSEKFIKRKTKTSKKINKQMKTDWIVLRKAQHAKKVLSNSPGLIIFAVMLLSTVLNSWWELKLE